MSKVDELLESVGLSYSELSKAEQDYYNQMSEAVQLKPITIDVFKAFISNLRETIEMELEKYDNTHDLDLFLKARLKNIRLIESFLLAPQKAKEAAERSINSKIQKKVGDLI